MSLDIILLTLRVAIALALYAFLAALLVILWRDMALASQQAREGKKARGSLILLECGDVPLEVGRRYSLTPLTTLGRAPTSTIVIPDTFASTDHAHIVQRGGQWWLEDQHSRNGTILNEMIVSEPVVLSSGDVISVGRVKLRVEFN